jgi:tetratricopeptide (TPR) repeat protein
LRILYFREILHEPDFFFPAIDASYHDYWARGIATGNWVPPGGREDPLIYRYPFYRPPLYAYILAALYRLYGVDLIFPRVFQMALGLAAAALAFFIGRRWFGETAGLIWSGLMAVYWIFIFYEGELVGESFSVILGLPLLWTIASAGEGRRGWIEGLVAGVVLGLYALLRPNVLVFFPVAAGWIVWSRCRYGPALLRAEREGGTKAAWLTVAGLALGTVLSIAPATIRNYVVSGELVPIAANAGLSIVVANNEFTDGTTHIIPGIGDVGEPFEYTRIVRQLERNLRRPLTHQEASNILTGQALDFVFAHPGKFLKLLGRKALLFWGPYEIRNLKETYYARLNSPVLRAIPLNFTLVFALGVLGAILFFARRRLGRGDATAGCSVAPPGAAGNCLSPSHQFEIGVLLVLFIVFYFLSMVAFAAADRYRIPLIPFLLLFGSLGVERMAAFARGKEWGHAGLAAAGGIALFGLFSLNPTGYKPAPEKWHYDRALNYSDMRDWENAIREYHEAIECEPQFLRAYNNLGNVYAIRDQLDEAARYYEHVLKLDPSLAQVHSNLGNVLYKQGKVEESIRYFHQALALRPDLVEAWNNLGVALQKQGKLDEAIEAYRKALVYRPQDISPLVNLGNLYMRRGRPEEAIQALEKALAANPGFTPALSALEKARRMQKK